MNGDLIPAVVAAGGGSALLGSIYFFEHRELAAVRAGRERLEMRFPRGLRDQAAMAALGQLAGLPDRSELIAETIVSPEGTRFVLGLPAPVRESVTRSLTANLPGLRWSDAPIVRGSSMLALRLFVPTPAVLRTEDSETATRALLGGLSGLRDGEAVVARWALLPTAPRSREAKEHPTRRERQVEKAWERKASGPGFVVSGLVLVRALSRPRARDLAAHVSNVLGSRRDMTAGVRITSERSGRSMMSLPKTGRFSGWLSAAELLPLVAWPVGESLYPGVEAGGSRELMIPRQTASTGRQLLFGRDANGPRPVAVSAHAATHHQAVIGPSGSGKSTLLAANLISDLERGHGGILLDPKADLLAEVADRVPREHLDRVVILDPAGAGPIPGVNALEAGDKDLATDTVLGALANLHRDSWGVRSSYYGRLGLRTLTEIPGARLTDLGRLFADPAFRRQAVRRMDDPLMRSAWEQFEQLSVGEAAAHVQPFLTKATGLLSRPAVRAVLAAPEPKLDVSQILRESRWLLIGLSPGLLGEAASQLIGAVLLYVIWSAIEKRAALPPEKRRPVFLYVDELATLAGLPFSFELLAERSRGLGAGLVVAMQTVSRLPEGVRRSLLGNVATLITFRASAEEAARLARELPGLTADDLMALGPFEVAARVGTGAGSGVATVTGATEALPAPAGLGAEIRRRSSERYGSKPEPTLRDDRELGTDDSVGRQRRRS